jgi:ATP-binding cassette subfamily G (WHITE) protein 2 (PDR)
MFFSVFLFTQHLGTIDQQVIPRLSPGRALFEARERPSKIYSWAILLTAHGLVRLVRLFWQTVVSVLIFVYYSSGTRQACGAIAMRHLARASGAV